MIVRPNAAGCELVTQPDHARLAGKVMESCTQLAGRPRRGSILLATREHDAGWAEVDAAPIVDPVRATVVDFIGCPIPVRQGVWPRSVARLADRDPWAAALVAQHAMIAYDRLRDVPEWKDFYLEMLALRDGLVGRTGRSLDELVDDYQFVRLGDMISLAFCTGSDDEMRHQGWAVRLEGSRVRVTPDPFGGTEVPLAVAARVVPRDATGSDEALRDALRTAGTVTLTGVALGATAPGVSWA